MLEPKNIPTPQKFFVWCPQIMDKKNAELVETDSALAAAEDFVENYDRENNLYFTRYCHGNEIYVRDSDGNVMKYELVVEARPIYIATKKK